MLSRKEDYETSVPCSKAIRIRLNDLKNKKDKKTINEVLIDLVSLGEIKWKLK